MEMIKFLAEKRIRFEIRSTKDRRVFCWRILVDFELQALISSGKSTLPSRVNWPHTPMPHRYPGPSVLRSSGTTAASLA
jgi:hypothetical protein